MERTCRRCGAKLNMYNAGETLFPCQDKRMDKIDTGTRPYYNLEDMRKIFGLDSLEQVRRKGRAGLIPGRIPGIEEYRSCKEEVDKWLDQAAQPMRTTSPLQEEAYQRCVKKGP